MVEAGGADAGAVCAAPGENFAAIGGGQVKDLPHCCKMGVTSSRMTS